MEGDDHPSLIIAGFMWLGNIKHAYCLHSKHAELRFSRVLNCGGGGAPGAPMLKMLSQNCGAKVVATRELHMLKCLDDFGDDELLSASVLKCVLFLCRAKRSRARVLCHCRVGVNRSPTVVLCFLLLEERLRFDEAFQRVKCARPCAQPHVRYVEKLRALDQMLFVEQKDSLFLSLPLSLLVDILFALDDETAVALSATCAFAVGGVRRQFRRILARALLRSVHELESGDDALDVHEGNAIAAANAVIRMRDVTWGTSMPLLEEQQTPWVLIMYDTCSFWLQFRDNSDARVVRVSQQLAQQCRSGFRVPVGKPLLEWADAIFPPGDLLCISPRPAFIPDRKSAMSISEQHKILEKILRLRIRDHGDECNLPATFGGASCENVSQLDCYEFADLQLCDYPVHPVRDEQCVARYMVAMQDPRYVPTCIVFCVPFWSAHGLFVTSALLLDGHHKLEAAFRARRPIRLIAFALEAYAENLFSWGNPTTEMIEKFRKSRPRRPK